MAKPPRDWARERTDVIGEFGIFRVRRDRVRSPRNGTTFDRHVLELPDWVNVVPVTADGRLVVVEQYRHGTGRVTLEFPAGIMEPGEDPCTAGLRELEEETGFRAAACEPIATVDANPAIQNNAMHVVLATGCTPTGTVAQDEGEDVRVRVVAEQEVRAWIAEGRMRHALVVVAWLLYQAR